MKYRIVRDSAISGNFEVQKRWGPFWRQCDRDGGFGCNTHSTVDHAEQFIEKHIKNFLENKKKSPKVIKSFEISEEDLVVGKLRGSFIFGEDK